MDTQELAACYFRHLRARDLAGLATLYAQDASFILPIGTRFIGKEAVLRMHAEAFAAEWPTPGPGTIVASQTGFAVECETTLPDGSTRYTANFCLLDADGLISSMGVYMRVSASPT